MSDIHTKFLKCLDKAKMTFGGTVERVSMNSRTIDMLMEAMHFPPDRLTTSGIQTLYGAKLSIDDELADEGFKMNGCFYSDGKVKCRTCHAEAENTIGGECVRCAVMEKVRVINTARNTQFAEEAKIYLKYLESKTIGIHPDDWTPTKVMGIKQDITAQFLYDFACALLSEVSGFSNPAYVLRGVKLDMFRPKEQ